jgi:hypothetical protein
MSETPEERRERLKQETAEDLRKPIHQLLTDIHEESIRAYKSDASSITRTLARFASLLSVLSVQAEKQAQQGIEQAQKTVNLTKHIVRLTWALVGLTVALLFLTLYLALDVQQTRERDKAVERARTDQKPSEIKQP